MEATKDVKSKKIDKLQQFNSHAFGIDSLSYRTLGLIAFHLYLMRNKGFLANFHIQPRRDISNGFARCHNGTLWLRNSSQFWQLLAFTGAAAGQLAHRAKHNNEKNTAPSQKGLNSHGSVGSHIFSALVHLLKKFLRDVDREAHHEMIATDFRWLILSKEFPLFTPPPRISWASLSS